MSKYKKVVNSHFPWQILVFYLGSSDSYSAIFITLTSLESGNSKLFYIFYTKWTTLMEGKIFGYFLTLIASFLKTSLLQ